VVAPTDDLVAAWPQVVRTLKATVRALYSAVDVVGLEGDTLVLSAPSDMHKKKCVELQESVCAALTAAAGKPITLDVRVQQGRAAIAKPAATSAASGRATTPDPSNDVVADEFDESDNHSDEPVESVVDQIAKQFPGARIVDSPTK
jgi:hypothetical protein